MSTKLNMNHIVVGEDGRVAIGDEQLAAIENQNINPSAGGWDIYQDPWLNDFMCKGGGTDFFCIFGATLNEYNCKGTVNTRCGNDWMCGDTKNRQCDNGVSCQGTTNATTCTNTYASGCSGSGNP